MSNAASVTKYLSITLSPAAGDNGARINAAIADVAANGGGTVRLAAGEYPSTTSVVMMAGVDLVGQGMLATAIQPAAVDGITFTHLETYGNSRISNLSVVGGAGTTAKVGIYQAGTLDDDDELYGITIDNVGVRLFNTAMKFRTVRNVTLANNWLQDVNTGINLAGKCLVVNIHDNKIVFGAGSGAGTSYAIAIDDFNYTAGSGVVRPETVRIRDNHIYGFEQGVYFDGVVYGFVTGCDIQARVNGVAWSTADAIIAVTDNYIQIAGTSGAAAVYAVPQASVINSANRIRDNHINATGTAALTSIGVLIGTAIAGNQDNTVIEGNSFTGFTLHDIAVYGSGHVRVRDNECYSSGLTNSILTAALPGISRPVVIESNDCAAGIGYDTADLTSGALRLGDNVTGGTVVAGNPWITPTFAAGNFTANGSMTWTVESGDVTTYAYRIDGKMMTVLVTIATTTVGGTPNTQLRIAVPAGRTSAKRVINPCFLLDNNVRATGYLDVGAGATFITVNRTDTSNFTASTNLTYVYGEITFEIQ
jgi:hypothetical protein